MIAMLCVAIQLLPFEIIDQKFLERGHSQMPCDSIHSSIEIRAAAETTEGIHGPSEWEEKVFLKAMKKHPLRVRRMSFRDFIDWSCVSKVLIKNRSRFIDGTPVNLSKAKWIRVMKSHPNMIFVKYDYSQDGFFLCKISGASGRPRPTPREELVKLIDQKKYGDLLPISVEKKKDLLEMCEKGIINREWHSFYRGLKTDTNVKDTDTCSSNSRDGEHFSSSEESSSSSSESEDSSSSSSESADED